MQRSQLILILAMVFAFALTLKREIKPAVEVIREVPSVSSASSTQAVQMDHFHSARAATLAAPENENQTLHKVGREVLVGLEHTSHLDGLSEADAHEIAPPIFQGALELKRFADLFEIELRAAAPGSPEALALYHEAGQFYKNCAGNGQTAESIRAVCFIEYLKLAKKQNAQVELSGLNLPMEVIQIAQRLH